MKPEEPIATKDLKSSLHQSGKLWVKVDAKIMQ